MNEELQAFLDKAISAGKSQDLVLFSLRAAGVDESYIPQVEDYFKKKRPTDSTVLGSQSSLRPSVSGSLSSEYIPAGFAPEDIEQQRGEIAKAAAADLYGGIIASRGDIGLLSQSPAFEESYRIYRSLSDDPAAQALPEKLVEEGQINTAAIPALKYGAVLYANDYIKKEQERQAQLGEKFTIPVLSELAAGGEQVIGGILKFTEMLGGRTGELGSFFIDDAAQRSRDALIDYGLTEDEISKGFIGNLSEGNFKAGLTSLGSTLIQQAPQLVAAAAAGPYGLAALGVSAGGSQYADVQNRSDLTANEKLVYSLGVGAAEYIAERLFLGDVNLLRKSLSKEGIEGMTKKELGELLFGYLPKGIRAVTEEGTEEALASIAQQTLGKFIAGDEINPIEIAESAIIGGLMGGSAYVASRGINALTRREDLKTKKDAEEYIKSMNDKIADPNISQEEKAILQKEKAKAENVVEQINRTSDRIALAMTEEDRQTVIGINNEIAAASKRYNSLQTDEARKAEAARVQELLNRKTEIENKYDSEEEAGVPSPIQEREAPIATELEQGPSAEAPEAGGVLQVPTEEGQKVGDLINTRIVYTDPISETIIEGELIQDGQRLVLEEDSGRQIDIGNVEELSGQAVGEIQVEGQTVTLQKATETLVPQEDGSLVYNLKGNQKIPFKTKMFNRQEGLKAIKRNKAGDVTRVTLQNEQGTETYNLTGREAEDTAYYLLRDFANNMELARLEQLIQQNEEVRAELERATAIAEAPVVAEEAAVPVAEEAVQPRVERGVIQESITKAGRVLNKLIPEAGVKVVTHNTKAEFDAAMDRVSMRGAIKDAIEYGRFIPSRNEIHINLQDSDAEAPLHEAFHAVFVNKFGKQSQEQREKTATEFESGIKKVLNSGTAQDIDLAKEMDRFVKDGGYSAEEAPEEFLAQLAGFMGVNYTQLSAPTQNKLIKWINDFIAKYLPSLKIKSNKEFVDFMNSFAAAANEQTAEEAPRPPAGMPQTDVDITFFPEEKSSKNSSKDKFGFIRSYLKDNDKFEKLKEEGYISENHTLDEFYGMPIILHAPDNAFTGNIAREVVDETGAKSTLLLVRGKGGMFYPLYFHEKGYFWASTEKAANTLASKMNKAAELGDGNIRMMLISSNVDKLLSSSVNAQGVIDILESKAFSKEMGFTKSELKKSLVFGINDIIDRKKKNQSPLDKVSNNNMPSRKLKESESLEDVLSFVRDFLNQDNSIFASRKRFIQSTLDGVSKSVKSDKTTKQFREFLGIETQGGKISSASLTEGFSRLLTEPMLDGVLPNMAYAVLEMNGPVKAIKTEQGKGHHESYPFAIASAGNEKAYIKLLKHPYNWMVNVEDLSKKKTLDLVKKPSDYTKAIPTTSGMSEVVILNQPSEIKSDFDGRKAIAKEKSSMQAPSKDIGGERYFHKNYVSGHIAKGDGVLTKESYERAAKAVQKVVADNDMSIDFATLKYNPKTGVLVFQEGRGFDVLREPVVGYGIGIDLKTGDIVSGLRADGSLRAPSMAIWHNKWQWVAEDYKGFDVEESKAWSEEWGSKFETGERRDIGKKENWDRKLREKGLPVEEMEKSSMVKKVEPVTVAPNVQVVRNPLTNVEHVIELPPAAGGTSIPQKNHVVTDFIMNNKKSPQAVNDITGFASIGAGKKDFKGKPSPSHMLITERLPNARIHLLDPENISPEENLEELKVLFESPVNAAEAANVLNVIPDQNMRLDVIRSVYDVLDEGGWAYFKVFVGTKQKQSLIDAYNNGDLAYGDNPQLNQELYDMNKAQGISDDSLFYSRQTGKDKMQVNQPAKFYQPEVKQIFGDDGYIVGDIIVVQKGDGQNAVEKSSKRAEKAKEQLDKLTDKAKETGSNLFWNKTQRAVRVFKEKQTSQMSREGVRINRFVKQLNAAIKNADKETLDLVNNVFDGTLSPELQAKLIAKPKGDLIYTLSTAMRSYIDSFAIDFLSDPSFNALPEELKITIAENFGEYMRGSYRFWKDKRFTPSEKAIDDAVEFEYNIIRAKQQKDLIDAGIDEAIAEDLLEELTSEAKRIAKEKVNLYLIDITRLRDSKGFKFTGLVSPSSIKLPSQQLRRRKDLPDVIERLLGKEKDPVIRFVDTAIGVSNIKYKGHMISSIFNMLGDTDMIKDVATSAEEASGEYKIVKDPYSPINGKYVHKDIFEAITDVNLYQSDVPFFQAYFNILKLARKSKVIYNLPTWRKNLTGGWYTMMANGVINPQVLADLKRRGDLFIKGETDAETEQLLDLMAELGLLGQAVDANIIGFTNVVLTRPINGDDNYYNAGLERLKDRVKGADQKLGQLYASVDDYTKLVIFRSELKNYSLKLFGKEYESLTEQQKNDVHEAAAESVKRTTPTFSRLEKFYTSIAGLPFGDFLSFEFEALRSMGENILIGVGDVNKGMKGDGLNDTQKKAYISSGIKRLMGASSVLGAHLAVPAILASLFLGDDDDLKEAIEALRPNWMEGHSIVPVKVTEDGIATVYDYSMEDPYGSFFDLMTDPTTFPSYITGLARPNMGVQFLMNIIEGKDIYGREIVESYDDPLTKGAKYAGYSLKSLIVPPFISSSIRDEMRRYEEEADKYDALDATGRVTSRAVIRDYQYNVGSQFYYFAKELGTNKKQYTDLTGIKRGNRLAELDEVKKMYDAIIKIGMSKGNYLMIKNARNVVKRNYETLEEAYILNNFKVKE
jgi:hypothetical protein